MNIQQIFIPNKRNYCNLITIFMEKMNFFTTFIVWIIVSILSQKIDISDMYIFSHIKYFNMTSIREILKAFRYNS